MSLQEVAQEPPSPLYARLRRVTKCAVQCGLTDLVHVDHVCIPAKEDERLCSLVTLESPRPVSETARKDLHNTISTHRPGHFSSLDVEFEPHIC